MVTQPWCLCWASRILLLRQWNRFWSVKSQKGEREKSSVNLRYSSILRHQKGCKIKKGFSRTARGHWSLPCFTKTFRRLQPGLQIPNLCTNCLGHIVFPKDQLILPKNSLQTPDFPQFLAKDYLRQPVCVTSGKNQNQEPVSLETLVAGTAPPWQVSKPNNKPQKKSDLHLLILYQALQCIGPCWRSYHWSPNRLQSSGQLTPKISSTLSSAPNIAFSHRSWIIAAMSLS